MQKMRPITTSMGFLAALIAGAFASTRADDVQGTSSERERELIAVLQSAAPDADKALVCKQLAVHGTNEAVPELAELLADERLASWARIALEVIPGPAADEALRAATESLQGKLLVGVINSIGVRRDAAASDLLADRLQDNDFEVASSAAAALGRIGTPAAAGTLREALVSVPREVRDAVAEGCVRCAEQFLADGNAADAVQIYDEVRAAEVPRPRMLEATRGAILARRDEGIPLLVEQLRSPDEGLFQVALSTAREFPGSRVDQSLADELVAAPPERAALVIQAMADRPETVVLPAIVQVAEHGPARVRLSAIDALGRVGNDTCLSPLLSIAQEEEPALVKAAKAALATLPGERIDDEVLTLIPKSDGAQYLVLLELIGERRIGAIGELLKAVEHSDKGVRAAALTSLGKTVSAEQLHELISHVVTPRHAEDVDVAQQALKEAAIRMPDREACASQLAVAMEDASIPTKCVLLEILGAMGGTEALHTLRNAARSNDDQLQDVSTRLLGEWMTSDAGPVLLELAKSGAGDKYEIRAIRGYIRIARQFLMPEDERVQMCRTALQAARRADEQKLVLQVLERYPSRKMLQLAVEAMDEPQLKEAATQAAFAIAQKLDRNQAEVQGLLSRAGLQKVKLEIIQAEYGAGDAQRDVTELLRRHAGDLQLIALPSSSFNAAFGGDPVPGTPKRLKVRYRINEKPGEATFAENAIIILPFPE